MKRLIKITVITSILLIILGMNAPQVYAEKNILTEKDFVLRCGEKKDKFNYIDFLENARYAEGVGGKYFAEYYIVGSDKDSILTTKRGITVGSTKQQVLDAYGETSVNMVDTQWEPALYYYQLFRKGNKAYQTFLQNVQSYVTYGYLYEENCLLQLRFYFNEAEEVSYIAYGTNLDKTFRFASYQKQSSLKKCDFAYRVCETRRDWIATCVADPNQSNDYYLQTTSATMAMCNWLEKEKEYKQNVKIVTARGIHLGSSKKTVISKYGKVNKKIIGVQDELVQFLKPNASKKYEKTKSYKKLKQRAGYYLEYKYKKKYAIRFYFNQKDNVSCIVYLYWN
ncbi:MAG: hypothetical protein J6D02_13045 [Lachnospira sp.]|nr:hypothetical protein [Lachnospira sp.]